ATYKVKFVTTHREEDVV
nr:ferredoxin a1 - Japanese radish (fragments) [Raphanus sativus var. niger]